MAISIGQKYTGTNVGQHTYILAQVEANKVCLISLRSGNRWANPVEVMDVEEIRVKEWKEITIEGDFTRLEEE